MSYEGYTEHLCEDGHRWVVDCWEDVAEMYGEPVRTRRCPRCQKPSVWEHSVDETNGVEYDDNGNPFPHTLPYPLEVVREEEITLKIPIYRVPRKATA